MSAAARGSEAGVRALETPEGVVLNFQLASIGERFSALIADVALIGVATAVPAETVATPAPRATAETGPTATR